MQFQYPFAGIGHHLENEIFDILKNANKDMNTYTQGPYQEKFEKNFAEKFELPNTIAVSNAASGLDLIANDLNLSKNDEIVCPAHTYCASAYPFLKSGASIVWCDIDESTWLPSKEDYLCKITDKTKAIIVVHLYGVPSDVYSIYEELRSRNIKIIEDCAQAIGSKYNNKFVGYYSDYSVFSFQSHKNISTLGEGGLISTKNNYSYEKIKQQRHNGHTRYLIHEDKYWKPAMSDVRKIYDEVFPSNFCMNEFQAVVGTYLLNKIDEINSKRKIKWEIAEKLLSKNKSIIMQKIPTNSLSSYHLLPLRLNINVNLIDNVFIEMANKGIQCAKQYQPLYRYHLFNENTDCLEKKKLLKNTDLFYDQMISVPFHESLSVDDLTFILRVLIETIEKIV